MNRRPPLLTPRVHQPRQRHFVDQQIQLGMMIALVALEIMLIVASLWVLYGRFQTLIEENLYRIHPLEHDLFTLLLQETGWVLLGLVLVNLMGLWCADRIWMWYVRRVLGNFVQLANQVADLDFRADRALAKVHAVLELMIQWRAKERQRAEAIRELLGALEQAPAEERILLLKRLRTLIPPYSRQFLGTRGPDHNH
ncbi:MAG: hypothetical protein HQL91_13080 [Magnetococcales bacterium]|nr:hypothetical protein [Magnetococcales bacterium]